VSRDQHSSKDDKKKKTYDHQLWITHEQSFHTSMSPKRGLQPVDIINLLGLVTNL
jgi:hypothetical protein